MRTEIRTLLRETDPNSSYWNDTLLNTLLNEAIDYRHMMLCDMHEGWDTEIYETPIVFNQGKYQLPEGLGRVRRILFKFDQGSGNQFEVPLMRSERWSEPVFNGNTPVTNQGEIPTYRLVGSFLTLEPSPKITGDVKLIIETDINPPRLVSDNDSFPLRWPNEIETLIIYDVAVNALAIEQSQGNADPSYVNHLQRMRAEYEARFNEFTEVRSFGRVFASPFYLGD